jgi:hypothetical protein
MTKHGIALLMVGLGACTKERESTTSTSSATAIPSTTATASSNEWTDWEGIQYRAPPGTNALLRDGVMPGPGGQGGIPGGDHMSVTLTKPNGFYVELVKDASPTSLEGEKYVLTEGGKLKREMVGKVTSSGWELSYDYGTSKDGGRVPQTHEIYTDIAGGHFKCTYGADNCPDATAAEAICRSLRPKPTL